MTQVCYILFCIFGLFVFRIGISGISDNKYGMAAVAGSIGIFIVIYFFDEYIKLSKEVDVENEIINEADEYMKNNKQLYQEALSKIESFKRRGLNASYQVYDVYERNEYEKACSIIYDYEKKKKVIDSVKTKRMVRDAKTLASVVTGFVIGYNMSKKSREEKEKK